ncbi:PREDICTED: classical arabinogalactan protein 27-like [Camelina sativa]|uniref:Classical arabinogalactan protein 27-like n=1 Tax=Camelina sativa TaxID=90675 RepID=A0ABM0XHN6_CAMSA|nr:PREDICTED: classical arabinogalactan protein 27-like [Camelina sativa]
MASSIMLTLIIFISLSSSSLSISSLTTNTIPSSPTISPFDQQISPEIAPLLPSPAVSSTTQTIPSSSTLPQPEYDDVLADPDPAFAPSASPPLSSLATPSSQAPQVLLSVVFAAASCFSLRLLAVSAL